MSENTCCAPMSFEECVADSRANIQQEADKVLAMKGNTIDADLPPRADKGEVIANLMLAYRHLEDAKMRLGKVFQALDGGESCYKK